MNFLEVDQMNLPYFLLRSLKKMSMNAQKKIQRIDNTMYHHGLIKILVEFHLQTIGDNWEIFLVINHFDERALEQPRSSRNLRGSKRKMETIKEKDPKSQQEISEDELPIVDILEKMKRGNLRRKKSSKRTKDLPQAKILRQEKKLKATKRKG